ncbi:hypothetical protein HDU98_006174 [Podochytrium sp. JEL0797]|nr:hypothetical protein HDU98_006174 [Podochytrium sp. JEL0797]
MEAFYQHIDANTSKYIERLGETIAIPSVSGDASHRPDVMRMGAWLKTELTRLNFTDIEEHMPGKQELQGQTLDLPPVILGTYGTSTNKPTVLVYGHYDVQPALKEDGWKYEPFQMVYEEETGRIYGRGSTDDKAPIISWLWVVEAYQALGKELPVNLKVCFEGMEESGSEGLDAIIFQEAKRYFANVDCVCISDNYWLGTKKPCLTYGLRGVSYFMMEVAGPAKDLHSGVFGGTVHEPMTDLIHVMGTLVSPAGKILIPGIYDDVAPVTEAENSLYQNLDFTLSDIHNATESQTTIHESVRDTLMSRWRFPSLSLHGIEGAFYSPGAKTVIPAKVTGKFSIRSVPDQTPEKIAELVKKHVEAEFKKLGSKNTLRLDAPQGGKCWVADVDNWNFVAARSAIEKVFKTSPDLTREGGSIPVTLTFQEALNKSVLLLPMGRSDDGAHSTNEKIDKFNYIEGIKLLATYLEEVAAVPK